MVFLRKIKNSWDFRKRLSGLFFYAVIKFEFW